MVRGLVLAHAGAAVHRGASGDTLPVNQTVHPRFRWIRCLSALMLVDIPPLDQK